VILGEKLVPNQSKGGICGFRWIESSQNELEMPSVDGFKRGQGVTNFVRDCFYGYSLAEFA
jgi:hypothetical protein